MIMDGILHYVLKLKSELLKTTANCVNDEVGPWGINDCANAQRRGDQIPTAMNLYNNICQAQWHGLHNSVVPGTSLSTIVG